MNKIKICVFRLSKLEIIKLFCRKYFDKQSRLFINVPNERLQNRLDREAREKGRPLTPTLRELRDWAHSKIDPTFQDFWGVCRPLSFICSDILVPSVLVARVAVRCIRTLYKYVWQDFKNLFQLCAFDQIQFEVSRGTNMEKLRNITAAQVHREDTDFLLNYYKKKV